MSGMKWISGGEGARIGSGAAIALAFLCLHGALAIALPLVDDEAYYALWSSVPDWGYYDHPPVVAWGIAAGRWVLGDSVGAVRAASILYFGGVSLLTWRLGYLAGGARVGLRALLAVNLMLPVLALGFVAVPDAPSAFFWVGATWALAEAINCPNRAWRWWALAGLAAGLGVQAKFTNLFLGLGLIVWALGTAPGRQALRRPQIWAAGLVALALMVPLVAWNAAHDWVGLERQFGRVGAGGGGWQTVAAFVGGLWLLTGPVFAPLAIKGLQDRSAVAVMVSLTSAPLVLFMAWQSIGDMIQPNWLVPVFPAFAVLAALGADDVGKTIWWVGAGLSAALGVAFLVIAFWPLAPLIPGNGTPNQMRGWQDARAQVLQAADSSGATWIATSHYALTGQLWWQLRDRLPVWSVTDPKRYLFRGPVPADLCDAPALLVEDSRSPTAAGRFSQSGTVSDLLREQGGRIIAGYRVTPVRGLKDCRAGS